MQRTEAETAGAFLFLDDVTPPGSSSAVAEQSLSEPSGAPPLSPWSASLGVERQVETCFEYGSLVLSCADYEEIRIVSAWFGHAKDSSLRTNITQDVCVLLSSAGLAAGSIADGVPRLVVSVDVGASTKLWGDPALFCLKRLEVIYDLIWLGDEEALALSILRKRVNDKALAAPNLEELLCRLASSLLGTDTIDACEAASGRKSPRWKVLGFQSCDPRTDLRTGRLALEALVYLAERYPLAAGQMVAEANQDWIDYPFAVASINMTQLLARYLGLVTCGSCAGSAVRNHVAPRRVVRAFAKLLLHKDSSGTEAFGELHAAAMARLHTTWRVLRTADPTLTIMDFRQALDATMCVVNAFFLSRVLSDALDFRGISQFDMPVAQLPPVEEVEEESIMTSASAASASLRAVATSFSEAAGTVGDYFSGCQTSPSNAEIMLA